ncbi:GSCFA domain-containing protein [Zavarzinia compransoris]|nr:GSCFA domain-containing protein [Zavarzinia compransoris]TDP40445.1 GSCFA family protein [Zavarzinia compransoris]
MSNPYRGLDDFCFWSRAMTWPAPGRIDPVVKADVITAADPVVTMGSCFAQHLARHISTSGLNYHVAEKAPAGTPADLAKALNYNVFSARYGNIYTVRQAVQLFDRAFGRFQPAEDVWARDGGFVDAFRPQIQPDPFPTEDAVRAAAAEHLALVRQMFLDARWLVFTLGLTEGWRSRLDGAVYPVAPGVSGGAFDPERHEFVNFTAGEVSADLAAFIERVSAVNPGLKIILTISPVPLIATYERRHVLVSTVFSKSALRVAADEAERRFPNVIYFPSFEIITSPAAGGRYYADDLRQVTDLGVGHVMRVFGDHFFDRPDRATAPEAAAFDADSVIAAAKDVVCDEEVIERALQRSAV